MSDSRRSAGHLPNQRRDGRPAPPGRLPRQRKGVTPQMHGRYPDFDVLEEAGHWDALTRRAMIDRVENVGDITFFDADQAAALRAFCDIVMAQDAEPRIPVLEMVDAKLAAGRRDGYQYAGMPDDGETWRLVARGLDEAARQAGADGFAAAREELRVEIVGAFSDAKLSGEAWRELDVGRAWSVVMRYVLEAFYSHPWAFNEIGFGGPAYPRGYARMDIGQREHWEKAEAVDVDPVEDVEARGLS